MDYKLSDLLNVTKLQKVLDELDEIYSIPSAIIDMEGNILTKTDWQDICVQFHRVNPDSAKECIKSDTYIVSELSKGKSQVVYKCPGGLIDTATPVIVDGEHLGNAFTGQFFLEPPDEKYYRKRAKEYGFNEESYIEALRKVPIISEEKHNKNLKALSSLTEMLAEMGLQQKRQIEIEVNLEQKNKELKYEITERKKAEKEQERLNAELKIKNKELEQILYVTSHDLRSPLANVEGFSKELDYSLNELMSSIKNVDLPVSIKEKITPIINENIPESLHYIQTSVSKMNTLLKGILSLSRLGRYKLTIEEIDMNELMMDIINNHRFQLNELRIKTEVSELPNCMGDRFQINQVFSNILDNAIKYSDSERHCIINISGYKDKNQSVYCIEDNGLGIAPEHQNKIFEIYHQLEPNRFKGEGMGLTIAHRIIEKHNGKIWVESVLSKGSKFYVSLPL